MKKIYYLLLAVICLTMASCSKEEPGGTATETQAGTWYVTIDAIDKDGKVVDFGENGDGSNWLGARTKILTFNTAANVASQMFIYDQGNFSYMSGSPAPVFETFKVAVNLNPEDGTFSVENGKNLIQQAYDDYEVSNGDTLYDFDGKKVYMDKNGNFVYLDSADCDTSKVLQQAGLAMNVKVVSEVNDTTYKYVRTGNYTITKHLTRQGEKIDTVWEEVLDTIPVITVDHNDTIWVTAENAADYISEYYILYPYENTVTIKNGKIGYGDGKQNNGSAADTIDFQIFYNDDNDYYMSHYGYAGYHVYGIRYSGLTENDD